MNMAKVSLTMEFDNDEEAREIYDLISAMAAHAPAGTPFVIGRPGKIVSLNIEEDDD